MSTREETNIYILRLENGKYYVGKSDNPMMRYGEHLAGRGAAWTRKHHPVAVEKIVEGASPFDEDKITKEYMAKYGIDNVRGGAYVSLTLDDVQRESITREIWASTGCCTSCGSKKHYAADCQSKVTEKRGGCNRCGRPGHYASDCYAQKDAAGRKIEDDSDDDSEDDTCYRCGRYGHYASECYARKDIDGKFIEHDD